MMFPKFLSRGLGLLAIASTAGAAGCSIGPGFQTALTPSPSAEVQAAIDSATMSDIDFPTFADIPAMPRDQRTAEQWQAAEDALRAEAAALDRQVAAMPTVEAAHAVNTAAFDALARRLAAVPPAPVNARAQAEAFARDMKARATPPPRRPQN